MSGLKLYIELISLSIRSQMEYKISFTLNVISQFLLTILEFMAITFLFAKFGRIKGYELEEIALLYGFVSSGFAVSSMMVSSFQNLGSFIKSGSFDSMLLRPRTCFLQVLGADFKLRGLGRFSQAILVFYWAVTHIDIHWSISKIIMLISCFLASVFLFTSIYVLQACLSFKTVESLEIMNCLTYGGNEVGRYPVDIYPQWLKVLFSYVIPLAGITYFGHGYLIAAVNTSTQFWQAMAYISLSFIFFSISLFVWSFSVKRYTSTGT